MASNQTLNNVDGEQSSSDFSDHHIDLLPEELFLNELWNRLTIEEIAKLCRTDRQMKQRCNGWFPPETDRAVRYWINRLRLLPYEERIVEFKQMATNLSFYSVMKVLASSSLHIIDFARFEDLYITLIKAERNDDAKALNDSLLNNPIYQATKPLLAGITLHHIREIAKIIPNDNLETEQMAELMKMIELLPSDHPKLDFLALELYNAIGDSEEVINTYIRLIELRRDRLISDHLIDGIYELVRMLRRALCIHEKASELIETMESKHIYQLDADAFCDRITDAKEIEEIFSLPNATAEAIVDYYDPEYHDHFDQYINPYLIWAKELGYDVYTADLIDWIQYYKIRPSTRPNELSDQAKQLLRRIEWHYRN